MTLQRQHRHADCSSYAAQQPKDPVTLNRFKSLTVGTIWQPRPAERCAVCLPTGNIIDADKWTKDLRCDVV